jgi:hypothetical protein
MMVPLNQFKCENGPFFGNVELPRFLFTDNYCQHFTISANICDSILFNDFYRTAITANIIQEITSRIRAYIHAITHTLPREKTEKCWHSGSVAILLRKILAGFRQNIGSGHFLSPNCHDYDKTMTKGM